VMPRKTAVAAIVVPLGIAGIGGLFALYKYCRRKNVTCP